MSTELLPRPLPHILVAQSSRRWRQSQEHTDDFSVAIVGDADDAGFDDAGVLEEAVFDFAGEDVLAACDWLVVLG